MMDVGHPTPLTNTHILSSMETSFISNLGEVGAASPLLSQMTLSVLAEEPPPRALMVLKQALRSDHHHDFCD